MSRVVNFVVVSVFLYNCGCFTVGVNGDLQPFHKIVLGVFTPGDMNLKGIIERTLWPDIQRHSEVGSEVEVIFVYNWEVYEFSLLDIRTVKEFLLSNSVTMVIGEYSPALKLVTDDLEMPYILTTWPAQGYAVEGPSHSSYAMLPHSRVVHSAVVDVAREFEWSQVAIIYDDIEGLNLIGDYMTQVDITVRAWKIDAKTLRDDIRSHLLVIRQRSICNIVVVCQIQTVENILTEALRLSMLSSRYSWVVLELNPYLIDFSPYLDTQVNLTTFQLFEADGRRFPTRDRLQTAVLTDALYAAARAAASYVQSRTVRRNTCVPPCVETIRASQLFTFLDWLSFNGSTGQVEFNKERKRTDVIFRVMALTQQGIKEVGFWQQNTTSANKRLVLDYHANYSRHEFLSYPFGKEVVKVVTLVEAPFIMRKTDAAERTGNDRYEGYLVDLMDNIAERLEFNYELYESPDGNYGSKNEKGEWNGMIRELIQGNASMCIGAISITSEREEVVDFAKPFKQKTFSILIKMPDKKTSVYQFLWPLSREVWALTMSAIIIVGFLLYLMDRCNPNSSEPAGRFTLKESLWFIFGSLVGASTEMVPRTISGRMLSGAWWFFALILISSYTANLAAFLTVTKIDTPINSLADLASQSKIKYGTVKDTYSHSFFKNNRLDIFKKMWTSMGELNPDSMVDNTTVGLEKVLAGGYAFIWDAPINKYITTVECGTMIIGEPFDEKGYGIGVPLGADYRDQLTMQVLNLNEEGILQQLEDKWWGKGTCEPFSETSTGGTKELNLENVAGVFIVLAVGAFCAFVVAAIEVLCRKTRHRKRHRELDRDSSTVALRSALYANGQNTSSSSTFFRKESAL